MRIQRHAIWVTERKPLSRFSLSIVTMSKNRTPFKKLYYSSNLLINKVINI